MKKINIYNSLGIVCFVIWIITTIIHVQKPHPYLGIFNNLLVVMGVSLFFIHNKINHIKSPLYDPDKKKHVRNWLVLILANVITVILVGFLFWKFSNLK